MPWPKTGASHHSAQLALPNKDPVIKGMLVWNGWDPEAFDLLKGLAKIFNQPSPELSTGNSIICNFVKCHHTLAVENDKEFLCAENSWI